MQSEQYPLYDPRFEHDACGIGAVISINGVRSHRTVDDALKIVEKLQHRAGRDASGETGDGVGLMMQIPHKLLCKEALKAGLPDLGAPRSYGVGMFFFPQDVLSRMQAQKMLEVVLRKEGLPFLGCREVPVSPEILGETARALKPTRWPWSQRSTPGACGGRGGGGRASILSGEVHHPQWCADLSPW